MPIPEVAESFAGSVNLITLGATKDDGGTRSSTVTIGGAKNVVYGGSGEDAGQTPVIAMDVLCFFGDLGEIFRKAHTTLRECGLFGFSVVKHDGQDDWLLNQYGHFAHSSTYIRRIARDSGFVQEFFEEIVLRRELDEDRPGYICLYRRA